MVGISTAQNIVNVLPAVQLMVNSFLFVETDFATKQNWSNGCFGLKESFVFDSKKNMDEWNKNKGDFEKYPWSGIENWLGEEQTKELYNELTSK